MRRDVIGSGACLPAVWFCGGVLVPVVSWNLEAFEQRMAAGKGPVLFRAVLADRLDHGRDHLESSVLRMRAFITLRPLQSARGALAAASAYAPAVAAVPARSGAEGWGVFECNYYGFTVAEVDQSGARPVIEGLKRAKHPAGGIGHQRRLMEEQLFDVALRSDVNPTSQVLRGTPAAATARTTGPV
ncbi:MAG: hypothetical protein ACREVJ_09540 [Gammaproteobacteria bacterium]